MRAVPSSGRASASATKGPSINPTLRESLLLDVDGCPPALPTDEGYQLLFEANPAPMWVYDLDTGRFLAVNAAAVSHYGYSGDEWLAMTMADIHPPGDTDGDRPEASTTVWRHRKRDGSVIHVQKTRTAVLFRGRRAELILIRDVTTEAELSAALEETNQSLRDAQELARIGRWEWDVAANRVGWSDELYEIFAVPRDTFKATYEAYLDQIHPEDRPLARGAVEATLRTGDPFAHDYRIVRPTGEIRWLHSRGRLLRDEDGRPLRLLGICQDITDQKNTETALTRLALHDPLTNLANRALLSNRLEQALARLPRLGGCVAVFFVDLDRFKPVNDSLGHAAGDQLLLGIASRLDQVVRAHETIARLGGDEFVVVCEQLQDAKAATEIAERILAALRRPIVVDGQEVTISASIGISLSGEPEASADSLLRDADTAMYQAKEAGRNRFLVFDPAIRARNVARHQRGEELQHGLSRGELRVFYQLEVDLADESATGLEALVRWQHPRHGLLPPAEFIDVAEETGHVVALGEFVIREACREVARRQAVPGADHLVLSVNLSARQLGEGRLLDVVRDMLAETGLQPSQLCFEITESVLMDDVEFSIEALLGLKALGVRLAIDDFGTGYSSLSYLRRFPVDVVKLDRSFVAGLGVDSAATAIVAATVNLCHALGLSVVAEGVETEEQLVALRALRCDRAQGYYWGRPCAGADLAAGAGAGRTALVAAPVDLYGLLVQRANALRNATDRPVVLQAPPTLAPAFGERGAVSSVLDQLLANAVKFSDPDRPVVVSAAADRRWVRVSVADFGAGMTPAEASRCFEQFWQAKRSSGRGRQGVGIGLYIVRSLVEGMGGQVAVRTAPGKGATFTFALPRSAKAAERISGAVGVGEDNSIREFMRQIGVPMRSKP